MSANRYGRAQLTMRIPDSPRRIRRQWVSEVGGFRSDVTGSACGLRTRINVSVSGRNAAMCPTAGWGSASSWTSSRRPSSSQEPSECVSSSAAGEKSMSSPACHRSSPLRRQGTKPALRVAGGWFGHLGRELLRETVEQTRPHPSATYVDAISGGGAAVAHRHASPAATRTAVGVVVASGDHVEQGQACTDAAARRREAAARRGARRSRRHSHHDGA